MQGSVTKRRSEEKTRFLPSRTLCLAYKLYSPERHLGSHFPFKAATFCAKQPHHGHC